MNILYKSYKHFMLISKHKIEVGKACFRAGLYWQGVTHDLSKYLPVEFIEYAQYYNGVISPVDKAKEIKGYCNAWLHHKGHNPHHYEYWIDYLDDGGKPVIMPYKYAMEMVCDYIGAGKAYNKFNWSRSEPIRYWTNKKKTAKVHPKLIEFFDSVFTGFENIGYPALDKKFSKTLYNCIISE